MKKIIENSDFDHGHRDVSKMHKFDGRNDGRHATGTPAEEFSDKGRADLKIRPNDPRFGDNPLTINDEEELVERDTSGFTRAINSSSSGNDVERLHDMLLKAEISDQEIKHGIKLTDKGKHKVAARLGLSPSGVQQLINTLIQDLRKTDDENEDAVLVDDISESLAEQYRSFLKEPEAGHTSRPFRQRR